MRKLDWTQDDKLFPSVFLRWGVGKLMCGLMFAAVVFVIAGAAVAQSRRATETQAALFTDAELAMYANMYESIGTAQIEAAEHISASDIVELTAAALEGLMESSFQSWRAGFENYLRTVLEMSDEEIVVAVYGVYAFRAVTLANLTLTELGP